jgi:hypothetical protein
VRQVGRLQDRQGIHVGAQADRVLAIAVAQDANDTGLSDAAMHLDAPLFKFLGDEVGGAVLLEPQFRVRVDVTANFGKFVLILAGTVEGRDGHAVADPWAGNTGATDYSECDAACQHRAGFQQISSRRRPVASPTPTMVENR